VKFFSTLEAAQADAIQQSARVLPQAFHELRKLNGAILQHAEREEKSRGGSPSLLSIISAAELMRNNFDILEALSNIEAMRALPSDQTISLYDLVYKVKKIFEERAAERQMRIYVDGVRAIIRGSQKSFPIVPAVLVENAIKYGKRDTTINARVYAEQNSAILVVENVSEYFVDPIKCFERGARYAPEIEGGGYGLFLAREIVGCHGGTIHCEVQGRTVKMIARFPLQKLIS
jgi:light-regulated signal transduction histidine kinase (bacteriophytochrome)